jgi:DNA-binding NarL/FixJ family response regulator
METLRILVVDDHEVVRRGVRALLEEQNGWKVVGESRDGREALTKAKELRPDVIVMDISIPLLNGLETTRQLVKQDSRVKVLILTMHESDPIIQSALNAGARGYLLKSDAGKDLVAAVEAVWRNRTFYTSKVGQVFRDRYLGKKQRAFASDSSQGRLTPRQREIVQLLAEGNSSKEVAVTLGVSVKTAETHRANIMERLETHSVTELVRYAIRNDIIQA